MFINKPKYAEHTQTESPSYFFCCDLRCRRCPRHADDIISNYGIFQGSASVVEWTMWTSQHRNIPGPRNCFQTFIRGLVMMRYNLKITFSLKCHPHIPRVSCREYRLNCSKVSESNNSDVRGFIWSS